MKKVICILTVGSICMGATARSSYMHRNDDRLGGSAGSPALPVKNAFGGEMKVTAEHLTASRQTAALSATGNVMVTQGVFRYRTDSLTRSEDGLYDFGHHVKFTTCSNDLDHLHWHLSETPPLDSLPTGTFTVQSGKSMTVKNAWLYYENLPVFWVPFWYYPFDTHYGWRMTPGYRSKWGGYLLSGYVYDIINEGDPDKVGFGGSTYADYRTENGFAVGQTLRWHLKDFGEGKVRAHYAWDEDADRYDRRWSDRSHNYQNWGSKVDRDRYRVLVKHSADFTERDSFRMQAQFLSDSQFLDDFFTDDLRRDTTPLNQAWYEHREHSYAAGMAVSGPIDRFYGGTAQVPEGYFDIAPQPIWTLPVNYESQTRAGYLNRDPATYSSEDVRFRYTPYIGANGQGADYQAFRADTFHRISYPVKAADLISFVPRTSYRATYWSDSGDRDANYTAASGDAIVRHIAEFGFTVAGRGTAELNDRWRHTVEPYLDYSFQAVELSEGAKNRYYAFDAYDRSMDWLDQFGFEGRGLPYDWHGIRPGIRNYFQRREENGLLRTVLDTDIYLACPFNDESYYKDGVLKGYAKDDEHGNYARTDCVMPGARIRYAVTRDLTFGTRTEYDTDAEKVAYSDIALQHHLTEDFTWFISYIGRDHRVWDYLPSEEERWNYQLQNILAFGFTHQPCDWFAWSPYIRHDCRRDEVQESGVWFDFMQDCLGYRVEFEHDDSYTRIDGSHESSEERVTFYIYLRALGPSSLLDLGKF